MDVSYKAHRDVTLNILKDFNLNYIVDNWLMDWLLIIDISVFSYMSIQSLNSRYPILTDNKKSQS